MSLLSAENKIFNRYGNASWEKMHAEWKIMEKLWKLWRKLEFQLATTMENRRSSTFAKE